MILFAAATGLRPAEWIALERRDVDREERVVYVRRSFTKRELKHPKTEASIRAVPLQARALDALDRIEDGNGSPLLFPGERGGYLDIHHFRPFQWRPAQEAVGNEAARRGEISAAEGMERVTRINSLKVRFLGDKVLQRQERKVAGEQGWETTYDAEYVALTRLQADMFVTSDGDLARAVFGLVETATVDALRTA
jgi:hypothetical protein